MASPKVLKGMLADYNKWVISNPNLVTDLETATKWTSYFIAGKINKSSVISELVYSLSNLFVLYNDSLILKSRSQILSSNRTRDKLKFWMTVLQICEVFIEMTARNKWGDKGKWSAAVTLQLMKSISNMILIYHYKETPVQHPPIASLQRKKLTETSVPDNNCSEGFVLRRSGRVVRKVEGAPPTVFRNWKPLEAAPSNTEVASEPGNLVSQRIAETIYVLKPMLHLGSLACFGNLAWKQWLISLGLDLTSLYLYDKELPSMAYEQRVEISRRKLCLLYYLLRSPMYNNHSQEIINSFLTKTAKNVPLTGIICNPILHYISHWQDTYFYMWAN